MTATWIESAAKGRNGGPVRAGAWAAVVIGTHPIEDGRRVSLEIFANDVPFGPLPAFRIEDKGANSLWHVPIPPQGVGTRLRYRSAMLLDDGDLVHSPYQETIVRPNLPDRTESPEVVGLWPEGLVGNRRMTIRVDGRGSTQDIYYPTVGLHSSIRPAEGDVPQSRSHFRAILGGLALGSRINWFNERAVWDVFQNYQGATNLLRTELSAKTGQIRVVATDFAAMGGNLPRTADDRICDSQYLKRYRIINSGAAPFDSLFGVYVHAEVNGGLGETGLSWEDADRALIASNRGHGHTNWKLARHATVVFAIALDDGTEVHCEPTGPNEAVLLRHVHVPANGVLSIDLIVSGGFTGWRGDSGTVEHWLRPALKWFRSADLDQVEQAAAQEWDAFVEPLPSLNFPKPLFGVSFRRSALAAALHADADHGSIASGFDRGLSAYCWPREAIVVGGTLSRSGHPEIGRDVYRWLAAVNGRAESYSYWFQKYSIDGKPEWETPAIDQTALVPWGIERLLHHTGDLAWAESVWHLVEKAARVCMEGGGHPGLSRIEDLDLIRSAGLWDSKFGAYLYSNAAVVAGLRAAASLAARLNRSAEAEPWLERAERIWNKGILPVCERGSNGPGLVDGKTGRFLESRRQMRSSGLWSGGPADMIEASSAVDIGILSAAVPFRLLPASDLRVRRSAEAILAANTLLGSSSLLARRTAEPSQSAGESGRVEHRPQDLSSLATLWMAQYLLELGRESGEARTWNAAASILDALLARLGPLGLALRSTNRSVDPVDHDPGAVSGVWGLHGMLMDTLLDFGGMELDELDGRLTLRPCLPTSWPSIGMARKFPRGEVSYRLLRPIGGTVHRLELKTDLHRPCSASFEVVCPGLENLGVWADGNDPRPSFDPATGRVSWSTKLPAGQSVREWTWG